MGVVVLVSLLGGVLLGRILFKPSSSSTSITAQSKAASSNNTLTMALHHAGDPIVLQRNNDPDSDACILLSSCFPDRYFAARPDLNPEAPLSRCQRNLKILLDDYDSGFLYEGKRLVGFISSVFRDVSLEKTAPVSPVDPEIELYNVCIHPDDRGRGLARSLVARYLEQLSAVNGFKSALVGLDVDFKSPSSKEAFTLYAKMGFLRWWQPCRSIADFDFAQVRAVPARFPAAWWFLQGQGVKKERFGGFSHFCMVKEWPGDDFHRLGGAMEAAINSSVE